MNSFSQWAHHSDHVEKHCSHLPIVGRRSNKDSCHNEESYEESDNKCESDGLSGMARAPSSARSVRNLRPTIPLTVNHGACRPLAPSRHPSGAVTRTHARANSLSTTPELHPRSPRWARPWYGMVMTGTCPSAGHARGSVCRRWARPSAPAGDALSHEPRAR